MTIVFALLAFFGGVIFGVLVSQRNWLKLADTVDAGDLLNAFATLMVAGLINVLYARVSSGRRADTDLLLEHVSDVKGALTVLNAASAPCSSGRRLTKDQQATLLGAERELSNAIHSLDEALYCCGQDDIVLKFDKLRRTRESLKAALTDSPFPGPYSPNHLTAIRAASKKLGDEVTRVCFAINRR